MTQVADTSEAGTPSFLGSSRVMVAALTGHKGAADPTASSLLSGSRRSRNWQGRPAVVMHPKSGQPPQLVQPDLVSRLSSAGSCKWVRGPQRPTAGTAVTKGEASCSKWLGRLGKGLS